MGAQGVGLHSSFKKEISVSTSSCLCGWQTKTLLTCRHLSLLLFCCYCCPGAVQDLAGLDGQLVSLTGYCMPSEELLRQVLRVGSELTSLTLYQTGGRGWCTGPIQVHTCSLPCVITQVSALERHVRQCTHVLGSTCLSQPRPPMPQHVYQNTHLQSHTHTSLHARTHRLQNHTSRHGPHSRGVSAATSPSLPGPQRPCCTCTPCA